MFGIGIEPLFRLDFPEHQLFGKTACVNWAHFILYINEFFNLVRNKVTVKVEFTSVSYDVLCHTISSAIPEFFFCFVSYKGGL